MSPLFLIGGAFVFTLLCILCFAIPDVQHKQMKKRHDNGSRQWDSVTGKYPID